MCPLIWISSPASLLPQPLPWNKKRLLKNCNFNRPTHKSFQHQRRKNKIQNIVPRSVARRCHTALFKYAACNYLCPLPSSSFPCFTPGWLNMSVTTGCSPRSEPQWWETTHTGLYLIKPAMKSSFTQYLFFFGQIQSQNMCGYCKTLAYQR